MTYLLLIQRVQNQENRDNYDGWVLAEATTLDSRVVEWYETFSSAVNRGDILAYMVVNTASAIVKGVLA